MMLWSIVTTLWSFVANSPGKMLNGGWGEVATFEATMVLYNSHEWHGNNIWFLQCCILVLLIARQGVVEWAPPQECASWGFGREMVDVVGGCELFNHYDYW